MYLDYRNVSTNHSLLLLFEKLYQNGWPVLFLSCVVLTSAGGELCALRFMLGSQNLNI